MKKTEDVQFKTVQEEWVGISTDNKNNEDKEIDLVVIKELTCPFN